MRDLPSAVDLQSITEAGYAFGIAALVLGWLHLIYR
jgi:hypothetical protein